MACHRGKQSVLKGLRFGLDSLVVEAAVVEGYDRGPWLAGRCEGLCWFSNVINRATLITSLQCRISGYVCGVVQHPPFVFMP